MNTQKDDTKRQANKIVAQLKNKAKNQGINPQVLLNQYARESLISALFSSKQRDSFVLKGGSLLYLWGSSNPRMRRRTKDVDFSTSISQKDVEPMIRLFLESCQDRFFVEFSMDTLKVEQIQNGREETGFRLKVKGVLACHGIDLSIDVSVSDAVFPEPKWESFEPLVPGEKNLEARCYPPEAVVSEKLDVICWVPHNSRLKDLYDIWFISKMFVIKGSNLQKAIKTTFESRYRDEYPDHLFDQEWIAIHAARWSKEHESSCGLSLLEATKHIEDFVGPQIKVLRNSEESDHVWNPHSGWL